MRSPIRLIALLAVLAGPALASSAATRPAATRPATTRAAAVDLAPFAPADGSFSISVPRGWGVRENLPPNIAVIFIRMAPGAVPGVATNQNTGITVQRPTPVPAGTTIDEAARQIGLGVVARTPGCRLVGTAPIRLDGRAGREMTFETPLPAGGVQRLVCDLIVVNGNLHSVVFATAPEHAERDAPVFDAVRSSFALPRG